MKATVILVVLVVLAMAALTAQPVDPHVGLVHAASSHAPEPVWMVLSGAALLSLASALRRYMS
jgi:hypothetical protein